MPRFKKAIPIIIITASILVHILFFGHPNETVFDEVHFGKFISGYFTHEYFFDIHPPLGKLLLSGIGYITGFKPGFSFTEIGKEFPDESYLWLRSLPLVAGILLPLIIYYLALNLGISRTGSFLASLLIVFDNALLVQSRLILLDSFLLFFGFLSLYLYSHFRKNNKIIFFILAIIFATCAVSVKWTGISFIVIIGILEFLLLLRTKNISQIKRLALFMIAPVLYGFIFFIHLSLLTTSGPGDSFMTARFQKTLINSSYDQDDSVEPLGLFSKIIELNKEMYQANATLMATHPYSSKWYTWPFLIRPIYYWNGGSEALEQSRIYFLANPLVWWLSTTAMLYAILHLFQRYKDTKSIKLIIKEEKIILLIIFFFFLNLMPFIGIKRVMFLYHYLPAYITAIICFAYLFDKIKNKTRIAVILSISAIAIFIFFAPLSYGLPMSEQAYRWHVWLPPWL